MAQWTGQPAYKQVADALRTSIRTGKLPIGAQLPSIADLMHTYEVSITVVRMALSELRAEGIIDSHQGKGSFVRAKPSGKQPAAPPAPEFEAIMQSLERVHDQIHHIDKRLDRLEKAQSKGTLPTKRTRRPSS
jgi:DNA-binding GntR family transcriptional regulator